ncbi:hypothetical protein C8T65DRAFT_739140 [Cerioporus squamosus]|nr:hypothetical protein C8T65DRAFT_739140 [Cerioporus squamosus]
MSPVVCPNISGRYLLATPPANAQCAAAGSSLRRHYSKKHDSTPRQLLPAFFSRNPSSREERHAFLNALSEHRRNADASRSNPPQTSASARMSELERRRFADMLCSATSVEEEGSADSQSEAGVGEASSTPATPKSCDAKPKKHKGTKRTPKIETRKTDNGLDEK